VLSSAQHYSPSILKLQDCSQLSVNEIGQRAQELASLIHGNLPLPETYVVTHTFLARVAEENKLLDLMSELLHQIQWHDFEQVRQISEKIQDKISQQKLPDELFKTFTKVYRHSLADKYFAIRASSLTNQSIPHTLSELHVQGESNIWESILSVWTKLYTPNFLLDRYKEWQNGFTLPAAFLIQHMVEAKSSGMAQTLAGSHSVTPLVTVHSTWGVVEDRRVFEESADLFEVNPRSWQITHQYLGVKSLEYVQKLDKLEKITVPEKKRTIPSLQDYQVIEIAKYAQRVARLKMSPHEIEWAVDDKNIFILSASPLTHSHEVSTSETAPQLVKMPPHQSSTEHTHPIHPLQISVMWNKYERNDFLEQQIDNVCVSSKELFEKYLKDHPAEMMEKNDAHIIRDQISQQLIHLQTQHPQLNVWYQSHDFLTTDLLQFPQGREHEKLEPNPFLGYKGALRILSNFSLFNIELDALMDTYDHTKKALQLIVPNIRTSSELGVLLHHFTQAGHTSTRFLQFWMECTTPENLLNLDHYCQKELHGFVIHVPHIHALMHGIDPSNPDIFQLYPVDTQLFRKLLKDARQKSHAHGLPLHLYLDKYHHQLVQIAQDLEFDGVLVDAPALFKVQEHLQR
jgi:pyruvate,water dikinase